MDNTLAQFGRHILKRHFWCVHPVHNTCCTSKTEENSETSETKRYDSDTKRTNGVLSWPDYFMGVAKLSAKRSKDPKTQVGACIVDRQNHIVGIGYNGFPRRCSDDVFPWGKKGDYDNTKYAYVCHAEANAILNSSSDLRGTSLYVTLFPCNECVKLILQSGITHIVYNDSKSVSTASHRAAVRMLDAACVTYIHHSRMMVSPTL